MPAKKTTVKETKQDKAAKREKSRKRLRISLLLLGTVLCLGVVAAGGWQLFQLMFSSNRHFLLRRVVVSSSGHLNGDEGKVCDVIGILPGRDNIFSLSLKEARDKLKAIPSVEDATVERILPDTLKVKLLERIPRAYLKTPSNKSWAIDSKGVAMPPESTSSVGRNLPVITGDIDDVSAGMKVVDAIPAVELINLTCQYFPDIRPQVISISADEQMSFIMKWKDLPHRFKVIVPTDSDLSQKLTLLRSNLIYCRKHPPMPKIINLSFEGNVVNR